MVSSPNFPLKFSKYTRSIPMKYSSIPLNRKIKRRKFDRQDSIAQLFSIIPPNENLCTTYQNNYTMKIQEYTVGNSDKFFRNPTLPLPLTYDQKIIPQYQFLEPLMNTPSNDKLIVSYQK